MKLLYQKKYLFIKKNVNIKLNNKSHWISICANDEYRLNEFSPIEHTE